ncbi:MAG: hypothetical protein QOE01_2922 [Actinomycetota bacterium]|jgi:hypothetical protein|nr:hypothetical protein [Actinomycetota bacterium]
MSIDDLAREAATDARRTTAAKVVPDEMLLALHRTDRQRRRLATGAAIATVAVLVAIAGIAFTDKAQTPTTRRTPTTATGHGPCADPAITCLGSHRYRIALRVPVTVTVPHNFQTSFNINSRRELETYRSDLGNTGGGSASRSWSARCRCGTTTPGPETARRGRRPTRWRCGCAGGRSCGTPP